MAKKKKKDNVKLKVIKVKKCGMLQKDKWSNKGYFLGILIVFN